VTIEGRSRSHETVGVSQSFDDRRNRHVRSRPGFTQQGNCQLSNFGVIIRKGLDQTRDQVIAKSLQLPQCNVMRNPLFSVVQGDEPQKFVVNVGHDGRSMAPNLWEKIHTLIRSLLRLNLLKSRECADPPPASRERRYNSHEPIPPIEGHSESLLEGALGDED